MRNPYNADRTAKTCSKCGEIKPLSEYGNNKTGRDGLRAYCRPCALDYKRAWYERNGRRNRAKATADAAAWRRAHADHYRAYQREYHREWARNNRDKVKAWRRAWIEANPGKVSEANRAWHAANTEYRRDLYRRKRDAMTAEKCG